MNRLLLSLVMVLTCQMLSGQPAHHREPGFPFIRNFSATEYNAHAQNFDIKRDRDGIMYFGNFAGVLQYDGSFWRLIPTQKMTRVSSLGTDTAGNIYVGALGEIGKLSNDSTGKMGFTGMVSSGQNGAPDFGEVFQIIAVGDDLCFLTRELMYRLHNGQMELVTPGSEILAGFGVNQSMWLVLRDKGLVKFDKGNLIKVTGGDQFSETVTVKAMLPYPGDRILIVTGNRGLYLFQDQTILKLNSDADPILRKGRVSSAVLLFDGTYAIGTAGHGILVLEHDGNLRQIIDRPGGLRSENVQALFSGKDNTLWAALNNGIALLELPSPLAIFDERNGLRGAVNALVRFNERLYAATYQGLFRYEESLSGFAHVQGINTACWAIVSMGNELVAATSQGVFLVNDRHARMIKEGFSLSLATDARNPGVVYVGGTRSLNALQNQGGIWNSRPIAHIGDEVNDLIRDGMGNIWGSTVTKSIFCYTPQDGKITFFGAREGLPETTGSSINLIGGIISVATRTGLYLYNPELNTFSPHTICLADTTSEGRWYSIITEDHHGNLWVNAGDESRLRYLIRKGESYESHQTPFLPVANDAFWTITPEPDGPLWAGGPDGLLRYDPGVKIVREEPWPTLLRKIALNHDSVIFYGDKKGSRVLSAEPRFRYGDNSLRFEFSAPFFAARGSNQYQFQLSGFDETWSDWSLQTHKEYTNLPAGKYTFRVRARNVYGKTAEEASFRFTVLPPWYSTWWAYLMYALFAVALVWLIMILRNRKLVAEKRTLEQKIAERTTEVVQQKEEIEKQSDELAGKNDELEKINNMVKSINSEIRFDKLLQTLLEKLKVIRSVERSSALVFDKNTGVFRFKACSGIDIRQLEHVAMTLQEAETRYLSQTTEVFEDIFVKIAFPDWVSLAGKYGDPVPKSMLIVVIRVENRVEAFLVIHNNNRENAFGAKELSFIRNSKEHIISAFIRTRIMEDLQYTLANLKDTQDQLVQSEKLASLGALTAGIAHEIQNPLNFVNNFSSLSADLIDEMTETINTIKELIDPEKFADIEEVAGMIKGNVKKINEHGKRAESIVKGMLQHSRGKSGEFEMTDINNLVTEYVNLAYHGMRAKDKSFNTAIRTSLDPEVGKASIIPQELSRVILNIVNNACYAVDERAKKQTGFSPEVLVSTRKEGDRFEIRIRDNGTGIPDHVREKIFNPFFTTKPTGKGTGLGLSMSFDIITQMHKGKLEVFSKEMEFTEFVITIPMKPA